MIMFQSFLVLVLNYMGVFPVKVIDQYNYNYVDIVCDLI